MTGTSDTSTPPADTAAISRAILLGVQREDPQALAAFFDATFDRVYGLALHLLGNREKAEDVAQDVFLRVLGAAKRLDPNRDPLPWLRTIVVNRCRDLWRSFGARVEAASLPADESGEAEVARSGLGATPETQLLAAEEERRVQRAMAALPVDMREVVVLRDFEGLGHPEIATLVGASQAAVRKRYSRALDRLAELLKESTE